MLKISNFCLFVLGIVAWGFQTLDNHTDWPEYNGDGARSHYSPLTQINKANVGQLKVAWSSASGGTDPLPNLSLIPI